MKLSFECLVHALSHPTPPSDARVRFVGQVVDVDMAKRKEFEELIRDVDFSPILRLRFSAQGLINEHCRQPTYTVK